MKNQEIGMMYNICDEFFKNETIISVAKVPTYETTLEMVFYNSAMMNQYNLFLEKASEIPVTLNIKTYDYREQLIYELFNELYYYIQNNQNIKHSQMDEVSNHIRKYYLQFHAIE